MKVNVKGTGDGATLPPPPPAKAQLDIKFRSLINVPDLYEMAEDYGIELDPIHSTADLAKQLEKLFAGMSVTELVSEWDLFYSAEEVEVDAIYLDPSGKEVKTTPKTNAQTKVNDATSWS